MRIDEISLQEIDLEDETFRVSEELDCAPLLESLREVGQLNPVILLERNSRKIIVCGFRRARAAKALGMPYVLGRLLPEPLNPERAFLVALHDNLSHRQLDPLEKARAVFSLRNRFGVPDQKLVRVYLPILGLNPGENVLRSYLLLHEIHPLLRRCFGEGKLTHASIAALAEMAWPVQDGIAAAMEKIRMSAGLQKKFLGLLADLGAARGNQPGSALASEEVLAIIHDSSLSQFQKGEKVYEALYRFQPSVNQSPCFSQDTRLSVTSQRLSHSDSPGQRCSNSTLLDRRPGVSVRLISQLDPPRWKWDFHPPLRIPGHCK